MVPFEKGLHQVAEDVWAWLLPDGSWGWSNAGLVAGRDRSLLVDTLFDLVLTREMLDAMTSVTAERPISDLVNTHANGDHCYGNELLGAEVRIHAAEDSVHEMRELPPPALAQMLTMDFGPVLTPYLEERFSPFTFEGVNLREPSHPFKGELHLDVGGRQVHCLDLGPAHTEGDVVVHVPDAKVLFAGDLLFIGGTPAMWAGPIANWVDACQRMADTRAEVVVPGHGPVTDVGGILEVRDYLAHVGAYARAAHAAGKDWREAAFDIDLGRFADLPDSERVVVTLYNEFRHLDSATPELAIPEVFLHMAQWRSERVGG